jgi:hypothetical protein
VRQKKGKKLGERYDEEDPRSHYVAERNPKITGCKFSFLFGKIELEIGRP